MENIDREQLAWAAGFFDGEGAVQIARSASAGHHKTGKNLHTPQIYLYLRVSQVDEKPLRVFRGIFGGSLTWRPARGNQNPQWTWAVSGKTAYSVLKLIRPWLVVKAERADLAIEFHEMCYSNVGWNTRSLRPNGSPGRLKEEDVELRRMFYETMKSLNLRGKAAMDAKDQVVQ